MDNRRERTIVVVALAGLGLSAVLSAGGCYRRVVGATGFGADQVQISEPYQENSGQLDRWFFGDPKDAKVLPSSRKGSRLN